LTRGFKYITGQAYLQSSTFPVFINGLIKVNVIIGLANAKGVVIEERVGEVNNIPRGRWMVGDLFEEVAA
jgi:hypothetical protein